MAAKVMIKELRALLMDSRNMLVTLAAPFLFRLFLPGFDGATFPAILVAYAILALFSAKADTASLKTGRYQFPVTFVDHVLGLFLFQALAVLLAALIAWAFVVISGPQQFMQGIIPKAVGVGLALTGLLTLIGLWLRREIARVISMVLTILVLMLFISQSIQATVFMPFITSWMALLLGLTAWSVCLALGLARRPQ